MARVEQASRYCRTCGRPTLHERKAGLPVLAGLIFSVVTAGLFVPVWLAAMALHQLKAYRCQTCGRRR